VCRLRGFGVFGVLWDFGTCVSKWGRTCSSFGLGVVWVSGVFLGKTLIFRGFWVLGGSFRNIWRPGFGVSSKNELVVNKGQSHGRPPVPIPTVGSLFFCNITPDFCNGTVTILRRGTPDPSHPSPDQPHTSRKSHAQSTCSNEDCSSPQSSHDKQPTRESPNNTPTPSDHTSSRNPHT
jgi:hypothetical protein